VPETVTEQMEGPATLVGGAQGTDAVADRLYSNTRTVWVEPTSGVIVNGQEQVLQYFRGPDGTRGVTLLDGTIAFDKATVAAGLDRARDAHSQITTITLTLPIALAVVGVLALVGGALLARRPRGSEATYRRGERTGALHAQAGS
jgi:hypothetical protein